MRHANLVSACAAAIAIAASHSYAQDLQYSTTMHVIMPSMGMDMPASTFMVFAKGSALRTEVEMPGMAGMSGTRVVAIMDLGTHKMYVLQPAEKQYMERDMPNPLAMMDSTQIHTAQAMEPSVRETGEQQQIDGYNAKRYLMSADMPATAMPFPGGTAKEGNKLAMVSEQWIADDAKLAAAYHTFAQAMSGGPGNPMAALINKAPNKGFPLKMTMLLVQVPKDAKPDAEALLKAGDKADGMVMRMEMETHDIKLLALDPSLFVVPKDYIKH